jgi:hypothetical protein
MFLFYHRSNRNGGAVNIYNFPYIFGIMPLASDSFVLATVADHNTIGNITHD